MKFFDLHCDTIGECCKNKYSLRKNNLHLSLEKAKDFDEFTQVFAIWIPDELRKAKAMAYFDKVCDYYKAELLRNKDVLTSYNPLNKDEKRMKAILAVEGGAALGGTIDGLYHLYDRGVRILTLTWNAPNEIASGAFSDGGLTEFGKEVVKKCGKLKMVIDVSHLNRQSFFDVAENTEKPFIASHSNPDIVETNSGRKRNLTDEQIEVIRSRGGLIGLNLYKDFLDIENKTGVEALKVHLDYLLEKGCEDIIAFGTDFDGCELSDGIIGIGSIKEIYNSLLNSGYKEELLKKLFYNNANLFFKNIIQ
ncbi:MAG: membrane dipeptidase [Clostridia bacterium]|nr:membrane dipeptidase [Clostridia bacterium]